MVVLETESSQEGGIYRAVQQQVGRPSGGADQPPLVPLELIFHQMQPCFEAK